MVDKELIRSVGEEMPAMTVGDTVDDFERRLREWTEIVAQTGDVARTKAGVFHTASGDRSWEKKVLKMAKRHKKLRRS